MLLSYLLIIIWRSLSRGNNLIYFYRMRSQ